MIVLVHGGGFDARCWDLLLPHLAHDAVAVDLPGRGSAPSSLQDVGIADSVARVVDELVSRDLRDVVLVGHSLAGITLPGVAAAVPDRLRRLVFVSCTVPPDGTSVLSTLDIDVPATGGEPQALDPATADLLFGDDMDESQRAWMHERLVAEAPAVITEPVDLAGLRHPIPRTWVRLLRDGIVPPEKQDRFIAVVGGCDVVDLDAGHMAMISQPVELAAVLDRLVG